MTFKQQIDKDMKEQLKEDLDKKKERTWDDVEDSDIIEMPFGLYKLGISKSKQEGYQLAQKETAEKVEKLKEVFNTTEYKCLIDEQVREHLLWEIDKIFKETK